MAKPTNPVIGKIPDLKRESKQAFLFDTQRRLDDQQKILTADDLSGMYDAARSLFMNDAGVPRMITADDLATFRHKVRELKKRHSARGRFRGGILIGQVLELAAAIDKQKSGLQIRTVIPISNKGGVIHFTTNASAQSDVQRHHVYVEFMDFVAWSASPLEPLKSADKLVKSSPIRYDCDCGRHTFWYRYICSIGGFAYGRLEDGYPKTRNPELYGVACKHVIKVMRTLQGASMRAYLAKMLERSRGALVQKQKSLSQKDQEQFLKDIKQESKLKVKPQKAPPKKKTPEQKYTEKLEKAAISETKARLKKADNKQKEIQKILDKERRNLLNMKWEPAFIEQTLAMRKAQLEKE